MKTQFRIRYHLQYEPKSFRKIVLSADNSYDAQYKLKSFYEKNYKKFINIVEINEVC